MATTAGCATDSAPTSSSRDAGTGTTSAWTVSRHAGDKEERKLEPTESKQSRKLPARLGIRQTNLGRYRKYQPKLGTAMTKLVKIIVEKHTDGYVAYPVGLKGIVIAQGDTYEEALADARSAVAFHIETFGPDVLDDDDGPVLEVFVAEAVVGA